MRCESKNRKKFRELHVCFAFLEFCSNLQDNNADDPRITEPTKSEENDLASPETSDQDSDFEDRPKPKLKNNNRGRGRGQKRKKLSDDDSQDDDVPRNKKLSIKKNKNEKEDPEWQVTSATEKGGSSRGVSVA